MTNPILTDAIIRLGRLIIAAVLVALGAAVLNVDLTLGVKGVFDYAVQVAWVAVIHTVTEFLRTYFGSQAAATAKPRAGALRARAKTAWDYLPI